MLIDTLVDLCVACADGSSSTGPIIAGSAGAGGSGGPPPSGGGSGGSGGAGGSGGSGGSGGPGGGGSGGPGSGGPGGDPDGPDITKRIVEDTVTEGALDVASKSMPWSSGLLGALGTIVSGSQTMAEGITVIVENDGRGLGGSSKSGKTAWEAIESERNAHKPPDDGH